MLCNPLDTSYETTPAKDRQTLLDVLRSGRPRASVFNAEAAGWLAGVLSGATQKPLSKLPRDERLDEPTLVTLLAERLGTLGPPQRQWVRDATAVAAYHAEVGLPVVQLLVCDDAPQFTWLTAELALCWGHEARHYNKLLPDFAPDQRVLSEFMGRFWDDYADRLAYRQQPSPAERARPASSMSCSPPRPTTAHSPRGSPRPRRRRRRG